MGLTYCIITVHVYKIKSERDKKLNKKVHCSQESQTRLNKMNFPFVNFCSKCFNLSSFCLSLSFSRSSLILQL
uniref:Uncharacterized protein n=1 Tax=Lutzomyia longipalpis TaxID=7200 RepID=A0A7G3B5D4_LUTLO